MESWGARFWCAAATLLSRTSGAFGTSGDDLFSGCRFDLTCCMGVGKNARNATQQERSDSDERVYFNDFLKIKTLENRKK